MKQFALPSLSGLSPPFSSLFLDTQVAVILFWLAFPFKKKKVSCYF